LGYVCFQQALQWFPECIYIVYTRIILVAQLSNLNLEPS